MGIAVWGWPLLIRQEEVFSLKFFCYSLHFICAPFNNLMAANLLQLQAILWEVLPGRK